MINPFSEKYATDKTDENLIQEIIGIKEISTGVPNNFVLYQNYPNPFNPSTKIRFTVSLNKGGERGLSVRMIIYDALGKEAELIVNQQFNPGSYEVEWDASNYSSGIYFYKLNAGEFSETKKMILVK